MPHTRPIAPAAKANFDTLLAAVDANRICLMSVVDTTDNQPATLICAVNVEPELNECFSFVPLAQMIDGDPYQRFLPPMAEGEDIA
jgi:hypothetical protein